MVVFCERGYSELTFGEFDTLFNKLKAVYFTLNTALRVIYADFFKQRKQETSSCPPLVLVLGIDEFNNLHDIQKEACKELIKSIGGVMCNFRISISDVGGHVRTLEYYYSNFAKQKDDKMKLRTETGETGYEKINLKKFLKDADFSHSFPDVEVALPETRNIKLYKLLHRYPATLFSRKIIGSTLKSYEKHLVKSV
ncbi:hypothetical protein C1646_669362 [Rhizophagus diaphanus]|nr:hypothetical protein C1646_669362 [Rhizophagus diaphanus] [Rhizophagus sp. MUCL 43196]